MARPAKSVRTLSGHITKEETTERTEIESSLRGSSDKITPPDWLNAGQRHVFDHVVCELAASEMLGNLDIYVLTKFAVAAERIFDIESYINERDVKEISKDVIFTRNSYVKDFWRGANELSLSPQARAKITTLNLSKKEAEKDPCKKLLAGRG